MTNVPFRTIDDFRDLESVNYYREKVVEGDESSDTVLAGLRAMGRDNARTPVQWDSSANAGFSTGEPWIPVNPNHTTVNVADDRASDRSIFEYYRELIALRHTSSTVALGRFGMLEAEHPQLFAFTRTGDDEVLLVLGNVSGEPLDVSSLIDGEWADARLVIGNAGLEPGSAASTHGAALAPWEARVYRR